MLRTWRILFLAVSCIYLAALVAQVFLAGLIVFSDGSPETHASLGWILHLVPILILVFAWAAKAGRQTLWLVLALAIVQFIQPILAGFAASAPTIAAFHPVLAMAMFVLAVLVGWRAWRLSQSGMSMVVAKG